MPATKNAPPRMTRPRPDVHRQITDAIVAAIEGGAGEVALPWHRAGAGLGRPVSVATGKPYRGVNVVALWACALRCGYASGVWGTYKQWQSAGAQVRKGERSAVCVFYKEISGQTSGEGEDEGEEAPETAGGGRRFLARTFRVFNADQVDGYVPGEPARPSLVERLGRAEALVAATGADVRHGGTRAFYQPAEDYVQMPERGRFTGTATSSATEGYYATLLHELVHWTGHGLRLGRDLAGRFGSAAYAMEELVAEVGAAMLCADLGVALEPRPDHAAYARHWLAIMRGDKRAVFAASTEAERAADYLAAAAARPHHR